MSERQYYEAISVIVDPGEEGITVRRLLERRLGVSRKLLSRLKMTEEGLTLNGERVYTSHKVQAGDIVALRMEAERSDDILPQAMELSIVYEDAYLLIVNKPAGIVVHPTHGHYTDTLANGVVYHWQEKGEHVRFRPVHRLDQDTSGVVAIAKNGYIHQQLSEQLQRGEVDKAYVAYVYGVPEPRQGTVNEPIDRNPESPHVRVVTPTGYPSVTHYETLAVYRGESAAKVRLKLETGRTHQIRVHMQHIGCPLAGDRMYGLSPELMADWMTGAEEAAGRQALHAAELALTHPMTGERMRFEAGLPSDLERLEAYLRSEQ
jgi:23S rRNA pseudouridine1911/1915/1917 synthase